MYELYIRTYNCQKIIIRNTVWFGKFEQRGVINRTYCRHQIISTYVDFGTKAAAYTAHRSAGVNLWCRRRGERRRISFGKYNRWFLQVVQVIPEVLPLGRLQVREHLPHHAPHGQVVHVHLVEPLVLLRRCEQLQLGGGQGRVVQVSTTPDSQGAEQDEGNLMTSPTTIGGIVPYKC